MKSIALHNLTVSYHRLPAIHHISAAFGEGESWAICGPNGAGKSTLLKAIVGLEKGDTGSIQFAGFARDQIAYLPQLAEVDRSQPMNVFELTALGLWYEIGSFGGVSRTQRSRILRALEKTGMQDFAKRQIGELSNGQFQRVLFSRMLVQDARFLLLDEPFNAIDEQTTKVLLAILSGCLKEQGQGVIAVLHDYAQVRANFDHTLLIAREKIASGKTENVLNEVNIAQAMAFHQDILDSKNWCEEVADVRVFD